MSIKLSTPTKNIEKITCGSQISKKIDRLAEKWNNIVIRRKMWSGRSDSQKTIIQMATADLVEIGIAQTSIEELASSPLIEVSFSECDGETGWDVPWELLLASATRPFRKSSLLVVRHLDRYEDVNTELSQNARGSVLALSPSRMGAFDRLAQEIRRICNAMHLVEKDNQGFADGINFDTLKAMELGEVVHLTGIDAIELIESEGAKDVEPTDIILSSKKAEYKSYSPEKIAKAIGEKNDGLLIVGCNFAHSGYSLAPRLVQQGANTAIGIEPNLDRFVSELFFYNFYNSTSTLMEKLRHKPVTDRKYDPLIPIVAFRDAWKKITPHYHLLRGSGIVIWSAKSILKSPVSVLTTPTPVDTFDANDLDSIKLDARQLLDVSIAPLEELNYSMLHNGRSLFDQFTVTFRGATQEIQDKIRQQPLEFRNMQLQLELDIGDRPSLYKTRFTIGDENSKMDFANGRDAIRVSLMSDALSQIQEPVQSSLFVELSWEDQRQSLFQRTFPVRLNPMDAWRLDDNDTWWLPSFVQPRDPAVTQIIRSAQNRLACMQDDPLASFSGYQQDEQGVTQQVQAIWHTIVSDCRINYISPPPSFSDSSQRLRHPSDVVQQQQGTCIDLAVLFASCLEWIELYPVIFMLQGHAFAGYWKSDQAYNKFVAPEVTLHDETQSHPWVYRGKAVWDRILSCMKDDESLVAIESTYLSKRESFNFAIGEEGGPWYFEETNIADAPQYAFHSMIDIYGARQNRVSALPISALRQTQSHPS
ncbi:hypothetical protein LOC67_07570 [Stieleria sp. JC731]|uniref:hypothetical protein n=1 Tax=Pirellulaceae TaxID=2691357 RepID=UPI001E2BF180|nr:hypothetical protein [Stieleria sp. JC731]MCC9600415.1 hypothetical protein [Stieleria sp. JC731]